MTVIEFAKLKSRMIGSELLEQPPLAIEAEVENPLCELSEAAVEKLLLPPT
jgi:hypothetical protein